MSSLAQIQDAIAKLPKDEREALSVWLASQSSPNFAPTEEAHLLKSLDDAIRDLNAGGGTSMEEARNLVRTWAGK